MARFNSTARPARRFSGAGATDIYQIVTDRIIAAIEAGAGNWRMPWHAKQNGGAADMPVSVAGRAYRGINVPLLWGAAMANGYDSNTWGTYRAWQAAGAQVRKGEKSTLIVFWKRIEVKKTESNDNGDALTDDKGRKFRLIARGYSVFNAAQVDGYCPKARPVISEAERDAIAESYFAAIPARVEHGGNRACYYPGADYIRLPEFEQFKSGGHYYATRGHESGHWTGHESRCNRDFSGRFGDQAYAAEELVAELAAAFLCAMLGLENEPRPDHAQYLAHWLGILKGDKRAIFTAASKAQGAVDFLNSAATANGFRFPEGAEAEAEGEGEADGPEAIGDDDAAEGEGEGEAERLAA